MSPGHAFHPLVQNGEKLVVVAASHIGDTGKVYRNVLESAVAHLPGFLGILEITGLQLEGKTAAFRNLGRITAVKDKIGITFFGGNLANKIKETLPTFGFEEFFRDMNQRFGEKEGPPAGIAFEINIKQGFSKAL